MIESFKQLGENTISGLDKSERKQKFLLTQTINPIVPTDRNKDKNKYNEIVINLDKKNEEIYISMGKELSLENREEFFGFKLMGRNSKKTYFTTNNLHYHLLTVPELIAYINEKLDVDKYQSFLKYLEKLNNIFYLQGEKKSYFNIDRINSQQRKKILDYIGEENKIDYDSLNDGIKEFVSKDILNSPRKNFVNNLNIFTLKINGKYITQTKYRDQYIDLVYYERQGRFFDSSKKFVRQDTLCSVCNQRRLVSGKIDIPFKFYITDKPNFFEGLRKSNAYKSFAICEECYQKIMIGISEVEKDYSAKLFNRINYYLIPKNVNNISSYQRLSKFLISVLSKQDSLYEGEFNKIRDIKRNNIKVDFLFYRTDQASFIVLENITDVYLEDLKDTIDTLKEINEQHIYNEFKYKTNLNSIYWLLFPNKNSHINPDSRLYRKELLTLFESIIKKRSIDYHYLLNNFNDIFQKKYYKDKKNKGFIDIFEPLRMNILLSWFNRITDLKGGINLAEGRKTTELTQDDIKEFFSTHSEIYKDNYYRQGIFLLGYLMNEILREQQNKSTTILDKINFDGMPVRRLKRFTNDITESLKIHKREYKDGKKTLFKINQLLYSQMMDRLQGIEDSKLEKDEVVFYLLSGISFGRYLAYKYSQSGDEN